MQSIISRCITRHLLKLQFNFPSLYAIYVPITIDDRSCSSFHARTSIIRIKKCLVKNIYIYIHRVVVKITSVIKCERITFPRHLKFPFVAVNVQNYTIKKKKRKKEHFRWTKIGRFRCLHVLIILDNIIEFLASRRKKGALTRGEAFVPVREGRLIGRLVG